MDPWYNTKIFFLKIAVSIVVAIIVLIPTWIFLLAWWMLGPEDFWQSLAILTISIICLGSVQVWLLIIGFGFLITLWIEDL
jgi:hypothetical protein